MKQIKVKSGKGELVLQKSNTLVGLRSDATDRSLTEQDYVHQEILSNLGGFQVVTLEGQAQSLNEQLDEVRKQPEVAVATHVYFAEGDNRPMVPTGDIYIVFQEGVSEGEQQIILDEYFLTVLERRSSVMIVARVTARSPNPLKVAVALQQLAMVHTAEPDLDMLVDEYFASPADDLLVHEWHIENPGFVVDVNFSLKKGADAKVLDAWRRLGNMGSNRITVAVIDNGFDLSHPDLKEKIVKPYNLKTRATNVPQGDVRFTHGTPCASVAVAASNGRGIVGAAPNARLIPVDGTSFSLRDTEEMFDYCVRSGADVISCSWGTTDARYSLSPFKEAAITRAARDGRNGKGCVIVYAVGNDDLDYVNFYAAHPDVIAVAASTSQDNYADYSNRGREVSICAPSNGDWPIIAARAWWDQGYDWEVGEFKFWRDGRSRGQHYKHFGGTSSSAPLVAGICALILSANPDLTAKEVKEILQSTSDKIGNPSDYQNGHSLRYGYGRVNADRAVAEALRRKDATNGQVPPPPTTGGGSSSSTTGSSTGTPAVSTAITGGQGLFRFDVQKQEPRGFGVQIGAYYDYGNVLIQTEKLQRLFRVPVVVSINELNGRTVYKVVLGVFPDSSGAKDLLQRVRAAGYEPFLRNLADLT